MPTTWQITEENFEDLQEALREFKRTRNNPRRTIFALVRGGTDNQEFQLKALETLQSLAKQYRVEPAASGAGRKPRRKRK